MSATRQRFLVGDSRLADIVTLIGGCGAAGEHVFAYLDRDFDARPVHALGPAPSGRWKHRTSALQQSLVKYPFPTVCEPRTIPVHMSLRLHDQSNGVSFSFGTVFVNCCANY